jgi:hypothetical protein
VSFSLDDVKPYLPIAADVVQVLYSAISKAIEQHGAGDPDAALATLNEAVDDTALIVAGLPAEIAKVDAEALAAEVAKFGPQASPLAPAVEAVARRLREIAAAPAAPSVP